MGVFSYSVPENVYILGKVDSNGAVESHVGSLTLTKMANHGDYDWSISGTRWRYCNGDIHWTQTPDEFELEAVVNYLERKGHHVEQSLNWVTESKKKKKKNARQLIDSMDDVIKRIVPGGVSINTVPSPDENDLYISELWIDGASIQVDHDINWRYVSILSFAVPPEKQNRGIGPALLDALFKQCPRGATIVPGTMVMQPPQMNLNCLRWMSVLSKKYNVNVGEAFIDDLPNGVPRHYYGCRPHVKKPGQEFSGPDHSKDYQ